MPVVLEISEAVIECVLERLEHLGPILAAQRATGCRRRGPGTTSRLGLAGRCGRGPAASPTAADLRSRGTLEPAERVAQPRQLVAEPLVARD
jgi:hypothetical protein